MRKRGDALQPGDVFYIQGTQLVFLRKQGPDLGNDGVLCAYVDGAGKDRDQTTLRYIHYSAEYDVASPVIPYTPAQQHADELLNLVRRLAARWRPQADDTSIITAAKELVEKIDPPKPTLVQVTDALDELVDIVNSGAGGSIGPTELAKYQELVARARRSP